MKLVRNNMKVVIAFILGAIIFSGATTIALSVIANDVGYDNTNSGSEKENVQDALDDLYEIAANSTGELHEVQVLNSNTLATRTANIKTLLPDVYDKLTVNNFYIKNAYHAYQSKSSSGSSVSTTALIKSYDPTTGILTTNPRYYSTYVDGGTYERYYMNFTIVAIYVD